jgi:hypothetical protein
MKYLKKEANVSNTLIYRKQENEKPLNVSNTQEMLVLLLHLYELRITFQLLINI